MLDEFTRLEAYSAVQLQYVLASEDLVRKNLGRISTDAYLLKPNEGSISVQKLKELSDSIKEIDSSFISFKNEGEEIYFIHPDKIVFKIQLYVTSLNASGTKVGMNEYITEEDDYEGEDDDRILIQKLRVSVTHNDQCEEILNKLDKVYTKHGLIRYSQFDVGKKELPVTFAFPSSRGIDYHTHAFDPITLDSIACNYSPKVINDVKAFIERAGNEQHGLFLIHGDVGVGKSYLIRAMITEIKSRRAVVCSPPTEFLVNAGLLRSVVTNFDKSLIIFEDVGEVVAIDSVSRYADARANLLNLSEGLMSLLLNGIIMISFNEKIEKIDPAILRPGRCLAHIEVGKLSYAQAKELVPFDLTINKEYSLAEIYEMRHKGSGEEIPQVKPIKKFGF